MADDFEGAGQRYAFLLRPLKDLSKNFEIDIAKELDDYCQQLESAADVEEYGVDNQHRFNFAEAAMLIQGSAFVFGRKVDYVHSQAVHFFEALKPQKTKKKKKGEDDEGFVDDNGDPLDPCDLLDYSTTKMSNVKSLLKDNRKSKFKGKPPKITVMPMSLMPLTDDEKNGVLIYSSGYKKEIVGKMDDFKMNSGFLNSRGVLLLQLSHNKIVDDFASEAFLRLWHPHLFAKQGKSEHPLENNAYAPDSGRGTPTDYNGESLADERGGSSAMELARRTTTGTINELRSARPSTRLLMEGPEAQSQKAEFDGGDDAGAVCYEDDFDTAASLHAPTPDTGSQRPSRMQRQKSKTALWEEDYDLEEDPTEKLMMDPFAVLKWKVKAVEQIKRFVKGTVIAARIEKVLNEGMTFQKQTMQTNDYVREHFYMHKKSRIIKADEWQADALYRFILVENKRRAEAKRERKAKGKTAVQAVYDEEEDDGGYTEDDEDIAVDIINNSENVPPRKLKESVVSAAGKGSNNAAEVQQSAPTEELHFGDIEDDDLQNSIDLNSLYGGFQPTGVSQALGDGQLHETRKQKLLAILHECMLKFWSTTEEVTSELVARVQEWEDTMLPLLEEEETRKEFNIHEYGDELLGMFKELGEVKTIDELMEGRRRYEISRYFLACLMMANTYNVEVGYDFQTDTAGRKRNIMKVTLLKRGRHHEVFDKAGAL